MTFRTSSLEDLLAPSEISVHVQSRLIAFQQLFSLSRLLFQQVPSQVTDCRVLIHEQPAFLGKIQRPRLNLLVLERIQQQPGPAWI